MRIVFTCLLFILLLSISSSTARAASWDYDDSQKVDSIDFSFFVHKFSSLVSFIDLPEFIDNYDTTITSPTITPSPYPTYPPNTSIKKWNTGHYFSYKSGDNLVSKIQSMSDPEYNNVQGVKIKIYWDELEKDQGQYTFDVVDRYLNALPDDKHLFLLVLDRDFHHDCSNANLPKYIINHPTYPAYSQVDTHKFCGARIWEKPIMDHYINLFEAIAKKYDTHPQFEGVITEETANRALENNQMKQKYIDQLNRLHIAVAPHFKNSQIIQGMNALRMGGNDKCSGLDQIAKTLVQVGHGISNPDTNPHKAVTDRLDQCSTYAAYQMYRDYQGQIPAAVGNDTQNLGDPEHPINYNGEPLNYTNLIKYIHLLATSGYKKDNRKIQGLGGHYMLWNGHFSSEEVTSEERQKYDYSGKYHQAILDFINQPNHETISDCPSTIKCQLPF